jgi:GT2 family glycosyltransferase
MSDVNRVLVVIVNFQTDALLADLVGQLHEAERLGKVSARVRIVDCSGALEQAFDSSVTVLDPAANIGFGPAVNLATADSREEIVLLVNPDVRVDAEGLAHLFRKPAVDAVAWTGRLRGPDGTVQHNTAPRFTLRRLAAEYLLGIDTSLEPTHSVRTVEVITGAVVAVDGDTWRAVGGFDEEFPLYVEDVDLCTRLRQYGRLIQLPVDVGTHAGGASARHAPDATWCMLHAARVHYARKRGPLRGTVARVVVVAGCLLRWVIGRDKREFISLARLVQATGGGFRLKTLLPGRPIKDGGK